MALKRTKAQLAYGIGDNLIELSPLPIVAVRNPATNDHAQLGTLWVNKTNNTAYIITSIAATSATWVVIT